MNVFNKTNSCIRQVHGFAYIWVLISVAFIISGLVLTVKMQATETRISQEKELVFVGRQFREAIRKYYESPAGVGGVSQYPVSLDELLEDGRSGVVQRHLRKIFTDPMTGTEKWGLLTVGGRIVGVHSLSTMEPIKKKGFDDSEASFRDASEYSKWIFAHPSQSVVPIVSSKNF